MHMTSHLCVPERDAVGHRRDHLGTHQTRTLANPFTLESGAVLPAVSVAFQTTGTLDPRGENAILICHPLTCDARAWRSDRDARPGWWQDLIGPGKALDSDRYFIVCCNVLGGCSGTSGPATPHPDDGRPWGPRFPDVSVRDMVRLQQRFLTELGIRRLRTVVGGSLGGFLALEWGALFGDIVDALIPIATTAVHRPWATAFNELARRAITGDPHFAGGDYRGQPHQGLSLARMSALVSYRHPRAYRQKFSVSEKFGPQHTGHPEPVVSYLDYKGEQFCRRFDANSYLRLIDAMDGHDLGRGRGGVAAALGKMTVPVLWIAFENDTLYPLEEQVADAGSLPDCRFVSLFSDQGHDAFLIEANRLTPHIQQFLAEVRP